MAENNRIRILHVFHSFNMGGLENGVVNLINGSDPKAFEHQVCCLSTSGVAEKRLIRKIPIFEMNRREGNDWGMIKNLFALMKRQNPHIVHTRNWGSVDAIIPAKLAGVPRIIHSEHGWNNDDPRGKNIKRRAARKLLSYLVDHFIGVSEDIGHWLVHSVGIPENKVSVVINGVDTQKFRPGDKIKARQAMGFSERDFIIGTVGRLSPIKNQKMLLEAFSRLDHDGHDLSLVLVGDGPERQRLEDFKNSLSCSQRIHFLGLRNDVNRILEILDLFVLPSKSEGICNTILEAMATGLPVVATDVGGNPELVDNNNTGFLVPSDDDEALAWVLDRYLDVENGLTIRHCDRAREVSVSRFSLKKMVRSYEKIYASGLRR